VLVPAASAASLPAGWVLRSQGRRLAILVGCAAYCIGHLLQGASVNMTMLMAGQVFHGIAASFLYQVRLQSAAVAPAAAAAAAAAVVMAASVASADAEPQLQELLLQQPQQHPHPCTRSTWSSWVKLSCALVSPSPCELRSIVDLRLKKTLRYISQALQQPVLSHKELASTLP
jgi:hypothetical protein